MSVELPFQRITIVGLGLMGGSLARALRRLAQPPVLAAASTSAADLERARADGVLDQATTDAAAAVRGAELVVYATPVGVTIRMLAEHRDAYAPEAVVTDLGSAKRAVVAAAHAAGLEDRFVGGHPMVGDHRSGYAAARAELYQGARVWLAPPAAPALERVAALWRALGARPQALDAEAHDRMMAWVSHLPQLTSSALGVALAQAGVLPDELGSGGRDVTRLAASSPEVWLDILLQNSDLLRQPMAELEAVLRTLREALERLDAPTLRELLELGRAWREPDA